MGIGQVVSIKMWETNDYVLRHTPSIDFCIAMNATLEQIVM